MKKMLRFIRKNETAATSIEYALIASILAIGAIVSFQSLGMSVGDLFNSVESAYENREAIN